MPPKRPKFERFSVSNQRTLHPPASIRDAQTSRQPDTVQAGNAALARATFNRILPLLNMGGVFRQSVVKHVLKHRGLIESAYFRDTNPPLDRYDMLELEAIIADLGDLMMTSGRSTLVAAQ